MSSCWTYADDEIAALVLRYLRAEKRPVTLQEIAVGCTGYEPTALEKKFYSIELSKYLVDTVWKYYGIYWEWDIHRKIVLLDEPHSDPID